MTGLVFNKETKAYDLAWEAFALRTGLILMSGACCLGPSLYRIIYRSMANRMNMANKLKLLTNNEEDPKNKKQFEQTAGLLKILGKKKHPSKQDIVMIKQTEKAVEKVFQLYLDEIVKDMLKYGMPQLEPFHLDEDQCLYLWMINEKNGENLKNGKLSRVLSFEVEDTEDTSPDVVIFYEQLAQEVVDTHAPTPLATLPNLNTLETEKLRNLRNRMQPKRLQLEDLLEPLPFEGDMPDYYAGTWNLDGIKALAPKLQKELDAATELQWSKKIHHQFQAQLHVGNMETPQLWELLHTNGIMPSDTYKVLQKKKEEGTYCPKTAYVTVTSDWGSNAWNDLSEEQALSHKRKTIDLD